MKNIFFPILALFISCNRTVENTNSATDTISVNTSTSKPAASPIDSMTNDTIAKDSAVNVTQLPDVLSRKEKPSVKSSDNTSVQFTPLNENQKQKINIRVYKNTESSGFGYDIILDGKLYIHQPNIPALPGNNGFASRDDAQNVAELVVHKIRNNIMPPTVEVNELEELGIK